MSGTSMACPHVAGAAAILLGRQPALTPAEVKMALIQNAGSGLIRDSKPGSPNKLLRVTLSSKPRPDTGNQSLSGADSSANSNSVS
jgi:subtilisin family serine protease